MIRNIIKEYADKKSTTVVCVTNSRVLINYLGEHILLIEDGKITLDTTKEDLIKKERNERPQLINDILAN